MNQIVFIINNILYFIDLESGESDDGAPVADGEEIKVNIVVIQ